jgi:hypothetical protein
MGPFAISLIVFACVFGSAVFGVLVRGVLPQHHLSADSKATVNLGMGLVATMSALVLGLLVSSAKSFYDAQSAEVTAMSSEIVMLDRVLAHYGPEAKEARDRLRSNVIDTLDSIWPQERRRPSEGAPPTPGADVAFERIQALSPTDDKQRSLQAQAVNMAIGLGQTRWLMYEQGGAASVSKPMLAVLVFWLSALFFSFGIFAPRNATVTTALFVAGLSVSGAIFLILEMYKPYGGLIQVSSAPLRTTLMHLGQ